MNCCAKLLAVLARFLPVALACHVQTVAAQEITNVQAARAAMVFNFLKFSEFPPKANLAPEIRLCVAVRDMRQAEALELLSGRKVGGRELIVADFTAQSTCDVFYVDTRQRWNAVEDHPALSLALTIGTYPGFASDGGMIEIAVQPDAIRFDINRKKGKRAGIHFSPQMLRLARQIHE